VRAVWPEDKPISARISAVDWEEGGNTIEDSIEMSRMLLHAGVDIIDVSTGAMTGAGRPTATGLFQTPFSDAIRAATGKQDFVAVAPVNLVYVADYSKMGNASDSVKDIYSAANTGFIAQNVYLFCASEGLATVVRGYVDKEELAKVMKLSENQRVVFSQTVGYPGD